MAEVARLRRVIGPAETPIARGVEHVGHALADLFDVIYRFYPPGVRHIHRMYVPPGEPVYEDTGQHRRLVEAAGRGRGAYPTWKAMIDRLGKRNSLQNESLSRRSATGTLAARPTFRVLADTPAHRFGGARSTWVM
jgi:hypothetical protein